MPLQVALELTEEAGGCLWARFGKTVRREQCRTGGRKPLSLLYVKD